MSISSPSETQLDRQVGKTIEIGRRVPRLVADVSQLIFVAGFYRSGTSLLYACLNRHPDIAIFYEAEILGVALPEAIGYHSKWVDGADMRSNFIRRHKLDSIAPFWRSEGHKPVDIYRAYARAKGARYGGEKSPPFSLMLPELATRFPNGKIITMSRDPDEILSSVVRAGKYDPHFGRKGMFERMVAYQEKMLKDSAELQKAGHPILHLNYQDLVRDMEGTCRHICAFLELPFAAEMCDPGKADLSAVHVAPHHEKLRSGKVYLPGQSKVEVLTCEEKVRLAALGKRWYRMRNSLLTGEDTPPAPDEPAKEDLQQWLKAGNRYVAADARKRALFHLLPAEILGLNRGIKLYFREIAEEESRKKSSWKHSSHHLLAWVLALVSMVIAGTVMEVSEGDASPLLFWLLAPMIVAWLSSLRQALVATVVSAIAWSFLHFYTRDMPFVLSVFAWNSASRITVLAILATLTVHLRYMVSHYRDQE